MKYNPHISNQKLSGKEWNGDCPICGKKGHFYMSSITGLWDCKKCGETGNWYKFIKYNKEGVTSETKEDNKKKKQIILSGKIPLDILQEESKDVTKLSNDLGKIKIHKVPTISLPENFYDITKKKTPEAYQYIIDRGYSKQLIEKYDLMYSYIGKFWNRIIIPIYIKGNLKGYLGRWIPTENLETDRKYRNSYGTDFSKLLGNYDLIDIKKPVIITEGSFSSFRIDKNSVYSFGKKLSDTQIALLKKKNVKEVVLLFDADAQYEILKISEKLNDYDFTTRILLFDDGDPDDLDNSDGKLYERILDQSEIYSDKTKVPIMKIK